MVLPSKQPWLMSICCTFGLIQHVAIRWTVWPWFLTSTLVQCDGFTKPIFFYLAENTTSSARDDILANQQSENNNDVTKEPALSRGTYSCPHHQMAELMNLEHLRPSDPYPRVQIGQEHTMPCHTGPRIFHNSTNPYKMLSLVSLLEIT